LALIARHKENVKARGDAYEALWKNRKSRRRSGMKFNQRAQRLKSATYPLEQLMKCFEEDRCGKWHLYEDRVQEFQKTMETLALFVVNQKDAARGLKSRSKPVSNLVSNENCPPSTAA
jgi:hypothetical protein